MEGGRALHQVLCENLFMCCVLSTEYRVENSVGEGIDTYREMDNSKTCWDKTDNTLKSDVVEEVEYVLIGAGLPRSAWYLWNLLLTVSILGQELSPLC